MKTIVKAIKSKDLVWPTIESPIPRHSSGLLFLKNKRQTVPLVRPETPMPGVAGEGDNMEIYRGNFRQRLTPSSM